ncbi:hypothetical protein HN814_04600 [Candidatus Woesearchaeota archaeon]|nr:hypothetical protein [Candidatus Woesearchaeota archaeon]
MNFSAEDRRLFQLVQYINHLEKKGNVELNDFLSLMGINYQILEDAINTKTTKDYVNGFKETGDFIKRINRSLNANTEILSKAPRKIKASLGTSAVQLAIRPPELNNWLSEVKHAQKQIINVTHRFETMIDDIKKNLQLEYLIPQVEDEELFLAQGSVLINGKVNNETGYFCFPCKIEWHKNGNKNYASANFGTEKNERPINSLETAKTIYYNPNKLEVFIIAKNKSYHSLEKTILPIIGEDYAQKYEAQFNE